MKKPIQAGDIVVCISDGRGDSGYSVFPVVGQRYEVLKTSLESLHIIPELALWKLGVNHTGSDIEYRGSTSCDFLARHFRLATVQLTREQREAIAKEWANALDIEL